MTKREALDVYTVTVLLRSVLRRYEPTSNPARQLRLLIAEINKERPMTPSRPWHRFRRRTTSDTWHVATNCSVWPKKRFVIADRPYPPKFDHGEMCDQCTAKVKAGTATFLPFHPPHYDPNRQ